MKIGKSFFMYPGQMHRPKKSRNKSGLDTEEMMCRKFWKQIEQLKAVGVLGEFDVFAISNNQRGGNNGLRQKLDQWIGLTKGVADYCIPGVGFLEAKRIDRVNKNGTVHVTEQEPEQKLFQTSVEAKGLKYALFWTPQMGIDLTLNWLGKKV